MEELEKKIEEWEKELNEVWRDIDTDAAEVERRNLKNLILNAKRRLKEQEGRTNEDSDDSNEKGKNKKSSTSKTTTSTTKKRRARTVYTRTVSEDIIEFLIKNGRMPKSSFTKDGKKVKTDDLSQEELEEVRLYGRWSRSKIKEVLDTYYEEDIENVPEEYREDVRKLRDLGQKGKKVKEKKKSENKKQQKNKGGNSKMNENEKRKQELQEAIERWENEIETVWKDKTTQAAQDEVRNLRNLIANARREIDEIDGNVQQNTPTDDRDPEEVLRTLKTEKERQNAEKGRLRLSIERLKEEREDYTGNKDLYDEYTRKIEETEKELARAEMSQTDRYKRITTLRISIEGLKERREKQKDNKLAYEGFTNTIEKLEKEYEELTKIEEEREKNIKLLTKGRMKEEEAKREIEAQIRKKQQEISEIEYDTENAMEEIELSSGEKVRQPKVLRLYKELDELKAQLKGKDDKIKEYQDAIDELKGIKKDKEVEPHEMTPDEVRYYHGQGDYREYGGENGEDTRKNRLDNDQYFAAVVPEVERPSGSVATPIQEEIEEEGQGGTGTGAPSQDENDDRGQGGEGPQGRDENDGRDQGGDGDNRDQDGDDGRDQGEDDDRYEDLFSYSKDTVKKIRIDASTGKAYVTSSRGQQTEIDLEDAVKSRRQLFKDLEINDILKERGANSFFDRLAIKRRMNPVILAAIQSDPDLVDEYVLSVMYQDSDLPFGYEADLNDPDMSQRAFRSLSRIGRKEKAMGANVKGVSEKKGIKGLIGRIFNKEKQLPEPEAQPERSAPSTRDRKKQFVERMNRRSDKDETRYIPDEVSEEVYQDQDDELEI